MQNLQEILESLGYKLKNRGSEWSCRPIYRESDNDSALSINKHTGEFYDFVLGKGGDFPTLIQWTTGKPLDSNIQEILVSENFLPARREIEIPIQKKFNKSLLLNLLKDNSYWNNRGISNQVLNKFQGGFATNGKMKNRYVIPIFDKRNDLIGFSGRYVYQSEYVPPWKHIGVKSDWSFPICNLQNIHKTKEVILVESIGNMLSLEEIGISNALVTFGVTISTEVIKTLLKLNINKIHLLFDNDQNKNSVGNKKALEAKETLSSFFDENQINIITPTLKDINIMLLENIDNLKSFSSENKLYV